MKDSAPRMIAGGMTGTSLDGLDVSLVEVTGQGLSMRAKWLATDSRAIDGFAPILSEMAQGRPHAPLEYLRAARQLGECYADAVEALCRRHLPEGRPLDLIVAHGQTIWHAPDDGLSWQLFDPQPLVRRMGVPVCWDLRQADLMAGGEGAPITPISDWVMFGDRQMDRSIVNLGGIANATRLSAGGGPGQVQGGDIGPCNILIDGVVRQLFAGRRIDTDGRIAREGRIDLEVLALIEQHPVFHGRAQRSLGREDFTDRWVKGLVETLTGRLSANDIVASVVDAVARLIARSPLTEASQVVLAGGGSRNPVLVERLRAAMSGREVVFSDDLGVPVEARESAGLCVLGALSMDRVPITLAQITGAKQPGVAGHWAYPGGMMI